MMMMILAWWPMFSFETPFGQVCLLAAPFTFCGQVNLVHTCIVDICGCSGRVVKALDSKSNGRSPRRFESCLQRAYFVLK